MPFKMLQTITAILAIFHVQQHYVIGFELMLSKHVSPFVYCIIFMHWFVCSPNSKSTLVIIIRNVLELKVIS